MVSLAPRMSLGELEIQGETTSFFGVVYIYYLSTSKDWGFTEFHGVLTQHGDKYRGQWTEGPDFEEMSDLFMKNPRLVELANKQVKRKTTYEEKKDG